MVTPGGKTAIRITNTNRAISPVQVGPWADGLNNREGDYGFRDIKFNELLACSNLYILESGILVNRSGFARYDSNIFIDVIGADTGTLSLRNVIGSVRLDNQYSEGLVQFYDSTNLFVYILKTSVVGGGEFTDFEPGYWIKQAVVAGQNYWLTSVVRYFENVYLTTNNAYLSEASTFTGGFYYGYSPTPTVKTVFATAPTYQSGPNVGLVAPIQAMSIDSADNVYCLISASGPAQTDGFITKTTPGGVTTTLYSDIGGIIGSGKWMCCDGTNLYISGFGNGSSVYGSPIFKVTPAGVVFILVVDTNSYEGMVYDPSINSIIAAQVPNSGSSVFGNLAAINVTTGVVTTIYTDAAGGNNDNVAYSLALSNKIPNVYYGIPGFLNPDPAGKVYTYSIAGPQLLFGYPNPTLGTGSVSIINDRINTGSNGIYVADGVSTSGTVLKINIDTQAIVRYITNLDGPTKLVEDSVGNIFVYESNQNRIIKADVPSTPSLNTIPLMPFGDISFMFKDRMWIVDKANNRLHYSKATDPTDWDTSDDAGFFDVNPGDGLSINDVVVSSNQMFIFKQNATWRFTFTADPGVDGTLAVLSHDRGAYSACVYNNIVYLVGPQGVQKLINGYFLDLSLQIRDFNLLFTMDSIIDSYKNRLHVTMKSIQDGNPQIAVMNLISGAWSTYDLSGIFPMTEFPVESHIYACGQDCAIFLGQVGSTLAVGAINNISSDNIVTNLGGYQIPPGDSGGALGGGPTIFIPNNIQTTRQIPAYSMQTLYYDFDTPLNWKKLSKISVDLISDFFDFEKVGILYPINLTLDFKSPTVDNQGLMDMPTSPTTMDLGPDGFPVMQVIYDVTSGQPFSAHRFQVITFSLATAVTPISSAGNATTTAFKRLSAFITQKLSKGEDSFIG